MVREYADDEANSETMTMLQMHVGGASSSGRAIHWHANPANRVEYIATDATRETIPYVKVTDAKGQVKEYRAADTTDQLIRDGQRHTMDCVDCHNTVGHPISPTAEKAVDQAIAAGRVSRDAARSRSGRACASSRRHTRARTRPLRAIERELRAFYQSQASIDQQKLAQTVAGVQDVYRRNVFPTMKVTFGGYPTNRGHMTSTGCFRCHDDVAHRRRRLDDQRRLRVLPQTD